jgi:hypothetical protein
MEFDTVVTFPDVELGFDGFVDLGFRGCYESGRSQLEPVLDALP